MTWTLDINGDRLSIETADELLERVLGEHAQSGTPPVIALLTAPNGACLGIGLRHPLSTLTYIAPGGWPSKHSVGKDGDELFQYVVEGQVSELPSRCMIPFEAALRAVALFVSEQRLSEEIEWEED
ncbi:hypothetical protein K2Y11_03320 [bacterium]|nr:hypothetical protein [bacterium]